jgi:hypothetical protein
MITHGGEVDLSDRAGKNMRESADLKMDPIAEIRDVRPTLDRWCAYGTLGCPF